jgi:hypothetical protein
MRKIVLAVFFLVVYVLNLNAQDVEKFGRDQFELIKNSFWELEEFYCTTTEESLLFAKEAKDQRWTVSAEMIKSMDNDSHRDYYLKRFKKALVNALPENIAQAELDSIIYSCTTYINGAPEQILRCQSQHIENGKTARVDVFAYFSIADKDYVLTIPAIVYENKIRLLHVGGFDPSVQLVSELNNNLSSTTITINPENYGDYPAVMVDLDNIRIIGMSEKSFPLEFLFIETGLYIEPDDPEITSFRGKKGNFPAYFEVVTDLSFENVTILDIKTFRFEDTTIYKSFIKDGTVIAIKTHHGDYYKLKIVSFDKRNEEMILKIAKIE